MVQHIEVTENKLRRLESEAEISASNINWVGKLPHEDCEVCQLSVPVTHLFAIYKQLMTCKLLYS
jgi:hypothetical protein